MSTAPQPDASWFPDPHDPSQLRWWDGASWTEHVREVAPPIDASVHSATGLWPNRPTPGALVSEPVSMASQLPEPRTRTHRARTAVTAVAAAVALVVLFRVNVFLGITFVMFGVPSWLLIAFVVKGVPGLRRAARDIRASGAALDEECKAWALAHGLEVVTSLRIIGGAPQTGDPEVVTGALRPLVASGLGRVRTPSLALRGELWHGSGTGWIAHSSLKHGDSDEKFMCVTVPLPSNAVQPLVGIAIDLGGGIAGRQSLLHRFGPRRLMKRPWSDFDTGASSARVQTYEHQEIGLVHSIATLEMLQRLDERATTLVGNGAVGTCGVIIAGGGISVWYCHKPLMAICHARQYALRGTALARSKVDEQGTAAIAQLDQVVAIARDVQHQIHAVWNGAIDADTSTEIWQQLVARGSVDPGAPHARMGT